MAKLGLKKVNKQDVMTLGFALAGGVVANQATNFLEKQTFMQGKEKYAPMITAAVGILGYLFGPQKIRPLFLGMSIVSGTEQVEALIAKAMPAPSPQVQGNFYKQLGFTPQVRPAWQNPAIVRNKNTGVVMR